MANTDGWKKASQAHDRQISRIEKQKGRKEDDTKQEESTIRVWINPKRVSVR